MCRSWEDIVAEKRAIDEDFDFDEDKEEVNHCGNGSRTCKKSSRAFLD